MAQNDNYLLVKPHVGHGHSILCQGTSFIWTNRWGRSKRFNGLQILDETVLRGHSLCRQRQADGHRREKAWKRFLFNGSGSNSKEGISDAMNMQVESPHPPPVVAL